MSNLAAIFGAGFDIDSVEPQGDFDTIPPGKYPVVIDKAEVKQTKKGDGSYVKFTMTVLDGPYRNRKLWPMINIANPEPTCVKIGLGQLSALGRATGITYVSDENQFLGKTCIAHVKVKEEQNEIRTYSAMDVPTAIPVVPVPPPNPYPTPQSPMPVTGDPYPPVLQQPTVAPQATAVGPIGQSTTDAGQPPWKR